MELRTEFRQRILRWKREHGEPSRVDEPATDRGIGSRALANERRNLAPVQTGQMRTNESSGEDKASVRRDRRVAE
jgi:hypothetical protein